jgi:DNA-binding response OmpR family regulator
MSDSLIFVHDDPAAIDETVRALTDRGWGVQCVASGADDAVARVFANQATAVVLFMDGTPDGACRALAGDILAEKDVVHPLLVFVNAGKSLVDEMRQQYPSALFVGLEELPWLMKHLSYKG